MDLEDKIRTKLKEKTEGKEGENFVLGEVSIEKERKTER
jgi:hypothetical protein